MKSNRPYLCHIRDALVENQQFVRAMTHEEFLDDRRTQNAVIRSFEVMGEASRRLSSDFRDKNPQVPWRKMMDFRNKLIHDYFGLDLFLFWETIVEDVPPLLDAIEELIGQDERAS